MYSFLGRIVQFETVQPFPAASLKIWTQTLWSKRSYHLLSLNPLNTTLEGKQPSQAVKPRYRNHLTYLARNVETRCCKKGWCITKNTHSAHFMKLITFYSMIELESLRTLLHQYKCMAWQWWQKFPTHRTSVNWTHMDHTLVPLLRSRSLPSSHCGMSRGSYACWAKANKKHRTSSSFIIPYSYLDHQKRIVNLYHGTNKEHQTVEIGLMQLNHWRRFSVFWIWLAMFSINVF